MSTLCVIKKIRLLRMQQPDFFYYKELSIFQLSLDELAVQTGDIAD